MTSITIDSDDFETNRNLQRILDSIADLTPANNEVGEYMIGQVDDRFRTETDPQRLPWHPLSAKNIALKKAEGKILKILQATGLMRSTVNYRADNNKVTIGLSSSYAVKHQKGEGVYQRKILGINRDDLNVINEIYEEYISDV